MSLELEQYDEGGGDGGVPSGPNRLFRTLGVAVFITALFVLAYVGVQWLADSVSGVIASDETVVQAGIPVTLEVTPGEPASQIARQLDEAGVVASGAEFERVVREARASSRLQAGTYDLRTGMEPEAVLAELLEGPDGGEVYRLTIIEGLTIGRMLESLSAQTEFTLEELTEVLLDGTVTSDLLRGDPQELRDWEGLLFPDTYEFGEEATAGEVLARLASVAEERVGGIDWTALEGRGLSPYDGIIIASLIEKEVAVEEDRPVVASVIFNRLDSGMRLQLDVTVVYALGAVPDGGLTLGDLEVNSPYNTYLINGLPPTPIAGVRLSSLKAAAEPAESDYLFFITTDESGRMTFTETFDEFLQVQAELAGSGG